MCRVGAALNLYYCAPLAMLSHVQERYLTEPSALEGSVTTHQIDDKYEIRPESFDNMPASLKLELVGGLGSS